MAVKRGRPDGASEEIPGLREERRARRSNFVGVGSLSCPECDAPAPLAGSPAAPDSDLACPYCSHAGAVRDFLTFGEPLRAPRVHVFVRI
jgi:hypothetical protein